MAFIEFYKYQGTGNDFIIIDDRTNNFVYSKDWIKNVCNRRFGIGADGLMLLQAQDGYDFRMIYYNSDGSESTMCGNGGRCLVKFSHFLRLFTEKCRFIAVDGEHTGEVSGDRIILGMKNVGEILHEKDYSFADTGSPHYVQFVDSVENIDVNFEGKKVRYHPYWIEKGGVNVNFVEKKGAKLLVRTYERGVEEETFSCGTGVTACALVAFEKYKMDSTLEISTKGGDLSVNFEKNENGYINIKLIGPAKEVFKGTITLDF